MSESEKQPAERDCDCDSDGGCAALSLASRPLASQLITRESPCFISDL